MIDLKAHWHNITDFEMANVINVGIGYLDYHRNMSRSALAVYAKRDVSTFGVNFLFPESTREEVSCNPDLRDMIDRDIMGICILFYDDESHPEFKKKIIIC